MQSAAYAVRRRRTFSEVDTGAARLPTHPAGSNTGCKPLVTLKSKNISTNTNAKNPYAYSKYPKKRKNYQIDAGCLTHTQNKD